MKLSKTTMVAALAAFTGISTQAVVIDFAGGVATFGGGGTVVTDNSNLYSGVDYYEENGFRLDFIGSDEYIGNYYGAGNAVIHGHWDTLAGNLTEIKVTKIGGGTFDLNYFILVSNTQVGGGTATGNEEAWIKNNNGHAIKLPSQSWGFTDGTSQIFLPSTYDGITEFSFYVTNPVYCFGMDEFFIDEEAPGVPDAGATGLLFALGAMGLVAMKRRTA